MPASNVDTNIEIKIRIFRDFTSNTEFIAIFIPFLTDARLANAGEQLIENLKKNINEAREYAKLIGVEMSAPGIPLSRSKDLVFSGRVFIYTLNSLDQVETGHLVESYRKDGMFLEIRGADYLVNRIRQEQH